MALGWRFNVFILIPTIILAAVGAAVVQAARGDQALSVIAAIALLATTLQISYLVGSIAPAAIQRNVPLERNTVVVLHIPKHMEVVGSDGEHVGTVDRTESADRVVLTGDDPEAGGKPHIISAERVDHVDSKVRLNKSSHRALAEAFEPLRNLLHRRSRADLPATGGAESLPILAATLSRPRGGMSEMGSIRSIRSFLARVLTSALPPEATELLHYGNRLEVSIVRYGKF